MRSYQIFASMEPERAVSLLRTLNETSPAVVQQAVVAAAIAIVLLIRLRGRRDPELVGG